jgi:hypothetical protein
VDRLKLAASSSSQKIAKNQYLLLAPPTIDASKQTTLLLPKLASTFFVISPILSDKACVSAGGIDLIRGNSNIQRKSATKYRHQHQEKMMGIIVLVLLLSLLAVSSGWSTQQ